MTAGDVQAAGDLKLAETLLVDADAEVAHDELDADTGEDIADAVLEQGEELTSSPTMKYVLAVRAWRKRWRCICQEEVVDSAHNGTHRADREGNVREPKAGCHEKGHRGPRLDPACPRGQHIESATIHESGRFLKHATPEGLLHECIKRSQIVLLLARPKICSKGRWHGC